MPQYVIAHDLGTTGNKATLYDDAGHLIASTFAAYQTQYQRSGWAEQDPHDWWKAVCDSTSALLASQRTEKSAVKAVSFSGQMMGCVPLDNKGNSLRPAIIWADTRAIAQAQRIDSQLGAEAVYRICGHRLSSSYSIEKIMWVKEHQPEIYAATHKFVQAKDYIICRLTGKFVTDYSDASGTNAYDLNTYQWSPEILAAAEIDGDKLPPVVSSFAVVGEITQDAAADVGLNAGTPVVAGGGDGVCATVGAGVVRRGSAYAYVGSSSWIALLSDEPVFDPDQRTSTWLFMDHNKYMPAGTMQSAGGSYAWLRDTLCRQEQAAADALGLNSYELMNLQAQEAPAGSGGLLYLPYLLGERSPHWNPNARGAFVGLSQTHSKNEIIRSVMEGVAFNLRVILECFQDQGSIGSLRIIGGGAKGSLWRQIMADIWNTEVQLPRYIGEATSLGAAVAGMVGVGLIADLEAAENLNPIVQVQTPNEALRSLYDSSYGIFNRAYTSLIEVYEQLASLHS